MILNKQFFNAALATDSYKASHWLQFPPETEQTFYYIESRSKNEQILFFGLQALIREYLSEIPLPIQIYQAKSIWDRHIGKGIFNFDGWERIVKLGYYPLEIKAIPEGTVTNSGNVLVTVTNTDPDMWWLPGWFETLLMQVWYPTTVATRSLQMKKIILRHLKLTGTPEAIDFKLHDFGFRGVSSYQSAMLGGMAHLVNFKGTDTMAAITGISEYYDTTDMPAFSIPAAEHSTMTSWGRENETKAYKNMLDKFAKPGSVVAVVSDSYDLYNAVENIWGKELKQDVIDSGATIVIRPDSGDPKTVVLRTLKQLEACFGSVLNNKGYKVLNNVAVIQGDGISDPLVIDDLLTAVSNAGFSADNLAFGMGGGLLQQVNRDTYKFAMKCSAAKINGEWQDVFKSPKDAPWKASKKGLLGIKDGNTTNLNNINDSDNELQTVFKNGRFYNMTTFEKIRKRGALC